MRKVKANDAKEKLSFFFLIDSKANSLHPRPSRSSFLESWQMNRRKRRGKGRKLDDVRRWERVLGQLWCKDHGWVAAQGFWVGCGAKDWASCDAKCGWLGRRGLCGLWRNGVVVAQVSGMLWLMRTCSCSGLWVQIWSTRGSKGLERNIERFCFCKSSWELCTARLMLSIILTGSHILLR